MNRDNDADEIDARLVALPRPELAPTVEARIHARSRAAFLAPAAGREPSGFWARLWSRALEPVAVAIAISVYLIWTTQALAAIDWGRLALPSTNRIGSMTAPRPAAGKQND